MPNTTDKVDNRSFRIPGLQETESSAEVAANAELARALEAGAEEQLFNLEVDEEVDTNPAILRVNEALVAAQSAALESNPSRVIKSPEQIWRETMQYGETVVAWRQYEVKIQSNEFIDPLRARQ